MKKLLKMCSLLLEKISIFALLGISFFVFLQIVFRNLFSIGLTWTSELSRFLQISMVFLMFPVLFREKEHVKLDFMVNKLSGAIKKMFNIGIILLCCTFGIYFINSFIELMSRTGNVATPVLNWPNLIFFFSGFVGNLFLLVYGIERLLTELIECKDVME